LDKGKNATVLNGEKRNVTRSAKIIKKHTCRDADNVPLAMRVCMNCAIAAENASYGAPI